MNIFVLSRNARKCARYHANKHVVKMILESAQLLCSAHIVLDNVIIIEERELYKLTHKKHPCAIWARASSENYKWLYDLFYELCTEYTYRYGKVHLCETKFRDILAFVPKNIPKGPITPFALAMPDECKIDEDAVENYRNYYKTNKQHLCTWTKREIPEWFECSRS
jgi:hypothetical protein